MKRHTFAALALFATAILAAPVRGSVSDSADSAGAIRFRSTSGLPSNASTIEKSMSDRQTYPNMDWGIPLTEAEASEIARRVDIQVALREARLFAQARSNFAGLYIDQMRQGLPVFLFQGGTDAETIQGLSSRLPPGTAFEAEPAERSLTDLAAIRREIEASVPELANGGVMITLIGNDISSNRVSVGVLEVTDAATEFVARFGSAIKLRQVPKAQADTCYITQCWPQKGGFKVYSTYNLVPCTSAFVAKSESGQLGLATAGHCVAMGTYNTWAHDNLTHKIGTASAHTWGVDHADADVAFILMNNPGTPLPSSKNQYVVATDDIHYLQNVEDTPDQSEGEYVCRTGIGTGGKTCGNIFDTDVARPSCVQSETICYWIDHTNEVDFDSVSGDSGGPYHVGLNWAYGIHVHSDPGGADPHGWFSTLGWARGEFFARYGVFWSFCRNISCTLTWPI